ncbi:MAG: hypothetical protein JNJ46_14970 [Myxococcales bacterium]|nr:hypothetical protein [Myxococcales bacterium]
MPLSSLLRCGTVWLGSALLVATASGCGRSTIDPLLRMRVAQKPQQRGCVQTSSGQPLDAETLRAGGSVRLTVARRASDGSRELICDAVGRVPTDALSLDLGPGERSGLEFYGEYFDDSGQRVASGALLSLPSSSGGMPPTLHMYETEGWSCPPSKLRRARGFHSATALSTGEVILVGGVEALKAQGPDVFGLIGDVEVFDPRVGSFLPMASQTGTVSARAMHQAAVVSTSGTKTLLVVYGGLTGVASQPALFVPDAPTQLRLMPGGVAKPGGAELLVYDSADRSLSVSKLDVGTHQTGLAGGAALPGGGLVVAGGAQFNPQLPFSRSSPAMLSSLAEIAILYPSASNPASSASSTFASGGGTAPWLLAPSVTPLSATTVMILGAKLPPDAGAQPQVQFAAGLPSAVQYPAAVPAMGPSTVFHTATRVGTPLGSAGSSSEPGLVLVTGGFVQDSVPPYTTRQPPSSDAVRLYTVSNPAQPSGAPSYRAITPYKPNGTCGVADGHYRAAGFEAATATLSGKQVLITGGTPSVPLTGCNECDSDDPAVNKLLCVLKQASLFDVGTQALTAVPALQIGRLGHQQVLTADGTILVTGGLVRLSASGTEASDDATVYNPIRRSPATPDPNDPTTAILKDSSRSGLDEVAACKRL